MFGKIAGMLIQQRQFAIVEIKKLTVHSLEPVNLDAATVEVDVGNKFNRDVQRIAAQIRLNHKSKLQLLGTCDMSLADRIDSRSSRGSYRIKTEQISSLRSSTEISSIDLCAMSGKP